MLRLIICHEVIIINHQCKLMRVYAFRLPLILEMLQVFIVINAMIYSKIPYGKIGNVEWGEIKIKFQILTLLVQCQGLDVVKTHYGDFVWSGDEAYTECSDVILEFPKCYKLIAGSIHESA